jgi:hypothetical protein
MYSTRTGGYARMRHDSDSVPLRSALSEQAYGASRTFIREPDRTPAVSGASRKTPHVRRSSLYSGPER